MTKKHSKFKIALNLSIGENRFLFYSQTLKQIINYKNSLFCNLNRHVQFTRKKSYPIIYL